MAEPITNTIAITNTTSATAVKGGMLTASTGLFGEMVIFTDHSYMYLAIVGSIVSMFGVLHELYGNGKTQNNIMFIITELIRGLALGVLAIPFWFLIIREGVLENISGIHIGNVSNSLALIVSFAASWYTIPIFDWITSKIRKKANKNV